MTDKSTILKAFNNHFFDFLADIIRVFPDNQDLAVAKTSFETIKRANPTIILKAWKTYVYMPYKDVIDGGDITFFLEKDYSTDLSILANSAEIMKIIDKLRQPIKEMDAVNKEHSIKYIQNLSTLSMLYV